MKQYRSPFKSFLPPLLLVWLTLLSGGCAVLTGAAPPLDHHLSDTGQIGECGRFFANLDGEVSEAGVRDWQSKRVNGFPYLRTNRFLASFADPSLSEPARNFWIDRLMELDHQARQAEIANLPAETRARLTGPEGETDLIQVVEECGDLLRQADFAANDHFSILLDQVAVAPDYSTMKSALGLYPLTSLFVRLGVTQYQDKVYRTFDTPLADLPVHGRLVHYLPPPETAPDATEIAAILQEASANPLGIPEPTPEQRQRLFLAYAPVWEVDTAGAYDRIGVPVLSENLLPDVDTTRPLVYTLLSHTRYQGEILLQLNYVIWFPSRPLQGALDILGGRLDGIIARVTLGRDGLPLFVDSIHNCGCYHKVYPGPGQEMRENQPKLEEPILVPQPLPTMTPDDQTVIRVTSVSHYIERIYLNNGTQPDLETFTYRFVPYEALRSLPLPDGGRHGLFGPGGIVPGTERTERWLLWLTGVPSPGAMRQWGNHAIAFFGRRHFDDPDLLERFFEPGRTLEP